MPDNQNHDGYGNYRDDRGQDFRTNDGKPISSVGTVTLPNGTQGYWSGGTVTPLS